MRNADRCRRPLVTTTYRLRAAHRHHPATSNVGMPSGQRPAVSNRATRQPSGSSPANAQSRPPRRNHVQAPQAPPQVAFRAQSNVRRWAGWCIPMRDGPTCRSTRQRPPRRRGRGRASRSELHGAACACGGCPARFVARAMYSEHAEQPAHPRRPFLVIAVAAAAGYRDVGTWLRRSGPVAPRCAAVRTGTGAPRGWAMSRT